MYRKIHLFDATVAGASFRESATIAPGRRSRCPCSGRRTGPADPDQAVGLSLCYDIRFPELYRIMAMRGATIMAVPAAFTAATGPADWEVLLRARAIENQVSVIGAGQVGQLPPGMPACHGHSMIVDPWGAILGERLEPDPGVVIADLDAESPAGDPVRAAGFGEPSARRLPLAG